MGACRVCPLLSAVVAVVVVALVAVVAVADAWSLLKKLWMNKRKGLKSQRDEGRWQNRGKVGSFPSTSIARHFRMKIAYLIV